jgi:predicted lipoprotein with Yx(FWY)xxD motif
VLVLAVAGCGGGNDSTAEEAPQEPSTQNTTTAANPEPPKPKKGSWGVVFAAWSKHSGIVLFDLSGHTLYRFEGDKGSTSSCYGPCAKAWPPALTEGKIRAVDVSRKLVGTTKRKDGTVQLTFEGHPLYTHRGEGQGDLGASGVTAFGAKWYALHRSGKVVTD